MQNRVIIVGGGLAGLAAAAALAKRNVGVTLLESRPRLGGRASSFVDRETGRLIDNCQHVSMGCCTNFRDFCESTGVAQFLQEERSLNFIGPDSSVSSLYAGRLPVPLHLWTAFRKMSHLSAQEKRELATGLRALARYNGSAEETISFADWLKSHGQSQGTIDRFWEVVLVSALSESLDRIDTTYARKVFVDAFLANRNGWRVQIPSVPLDELYGGQLTDWFAGFGTTLRLGTGVTRLHLDEGASRMVSAELRSGERLTADDFVVAVPHHRLPELLSPVLMGDAYFAESSQLESSPISSVHLWFDRQLTDLPHAVFVGRLSQWIFQRPAPAGSTQVQNPEAGSEPAAITERAHYYQVVISASRMLAGHTSEETIAEVIRELGEVWPQAQRAQLLHARLITEHKAVFSVTPGSNRFRPPQQTPVANLQLAGDWTHTGWPATMESAVRSGYLAAENVLTRLGRPEPILVPDLPVSLLSKLLLKL